MWPEKPLSDTSNESFFSRSRPLTVWRLVSLLNVCGWLICQLPMRFLGWERLMTSSCEVRLWNIQVWNSETHQAIANKHRNGIGICNSAPVLDHNKWNRKLSESNRQLFFSLLLRKPHSVCIHPLKMGSQIEDMKSSLLFTPGLFSRLDLEHTLQGTYINLRRFYLQILSMNAITHNTVLAGTKAFPLS